MTYIFTCKKDWFSKNKPIVIHTGLLFYPLHIFELSKVFISVCWIIDTIDLESVWHWNGVKPMRQKVSRRISLNQGVGSTKVKNSFDGAFLHVLYNLLKTLTPFFLKSWLHTGCLIVKWEILNGSEG